MTLSKRHLATCIEDFLKIERKMVRKIVQDTLSCLLRSKVVFGGGASIGDFKNFELFLFLKKIYDF
jgi:hypothetical protein